MFATCCIGVGSPHGDDQAAWRIVERLLNRAEVESSLDALRIVAVADPLHLLEHIDPCDRLIVVDACRTGAPPGTVSQFRWPDARIAHQHGRSTHGCDIAMALKLAEALDKLPDEVVLFGIEIEACRPGTDLSSSVVAGLDALERNLLREIQGLPPEGGGIHVDNEMHLRGDRAGSGT
jgi:hydrogenase maturation protease